jgi:hypothetical protein
VRFAAEHVMPRARRSPHLVVLQHVGVDEHTRVRLRPRRRTPPLASAT